MFRRFISSPRSRVLTSSTAHLRWCHSSTSTTTTSTGETLLLLSPKLKQLFSHQKSSTKELDINKMQVCDDDLKNLFQIFPKLEELCVSNNPLNGRFLENILAKDELQCYPKLRVLDITDCPTGIGSVEEGEKFEKVYFDENIPRLFGSSLEVLIAAENFHWVPKSKLLYNFPESTSPNNNNKLRKLDFANSDPCEIHIGENLHKFRETLEELSLSHHSNFTGKMFRLIPSECVFLKMKELDLWSSCDDVLLSENEKGIGMKELCKHIREKFPNLEKFKISCENKDDEEENEECGQEGYGDEVFELAMKLNKLRVLYCSNFLSEKQVVELQKLRPELDISIL